MPKQDVTENGVLIGVAATRVGRGDMIVSGAQDRLDPRVWRDADRLLVPACFSISCCECDVGSHIGSVEQARAEKWTQIVFDPGGYTWNYLGLCLECRKESEAR